MKLGIFVSLGLGSALELNIAEGLNEALDARSVKIEDGGTFNSEKCKQATGWTLLKLGDKSNQVDLKETTAEESSGDYELKDNVVTIAQNNKKREMMGLLACHDGTNALDLFQITGAPSFGNLANSLTNLDGDINKRVDCAVTGFPLPLISWRFQAIDKEEAETQCQGGVCTPCLDDECLEDDNNRNSSSIYNVPTIATAVQVRYSASGENKCPMNTDSLEDHPDCKLAASQEEVDALDKSLRQRSQLFFPNIKYAQRGKYICMATQEFKLPGKESVEKPKSFIWRVKDPTAALWPFLALVAEVSIVVAIILYYERASAAKKGDNDDVEEGDEFIAKKEQN